MTTRTIYRICAVGAAVAVLMLVMMALFRDSTISVVDLVAGGKSPGTAELNRAMTYMRTQLAMDVIFIAAWIIGWIGLSLLVRTRNKVIGNVGLIVGLIAPLLDFTENEILWALLQNAPTNSVPQTGWFTAWQVVAQLSYLLTFIGAMIIAIGLWSKHWLDRSMTIIGTFCAALALVGIYIPAISLLPYIWYIVWFAGAALLLWRSAGEQQDPA